MRSFGIASIAMALAVLPAPTLAQVTQTYQYDGNGRLIGVSTTGGAGSHSSVYTYDDANNRMFRSQTGTTAYAAIPQNLGYKLWLDRTFAADSLALAFSGRAPDTLSNRSSGVASTRAAIADEPTYAMATLSSVEPIPANGSTQ